MYKLFFIFSITFFFKSFAQIDLVKKLMTNKYVLVKYQANGHGNYLQEMRELIKEWPKSDLPTDIMWSFVNDPSNDSHRRTLKQLKYSKGDTLLVVNWDVQNNIFPDAKVTKFKFNTRDSMLYFYNSQYFHEATMVKKIIRKTRKFKVVKVSETEIILLDKDRTKDVILFYLKIKK